MYLNFTAGITRSHYDKHKGQRTFYSWVSLVSILRGCSDPENISPTVSRNVIVTLWSQLPREGTWVSTGDIFIALWNNNEFCKVMKQTVFCMWTLWTGMWHQSWFMKIGKKQISTKLEFSLLQAFEIHISCYEKYKKEFWFIAMGNNSSFMFNSFFLLSWTITLIYIKM